MGKLIKKILNPLSFIILIGSIVHIGFFSVNEILKNADSFAYLQMSYHLKNFSVEGFGTGWFGFVYSLFIAIFDTITFYVNEYSASQFLNIILLGFGSIILYKISNKILSKNYSLLVIILFYMSSTFLGFNIQILSENIYIVVFLGLIYYLLESLVIPVKTGISSKSKQEKISNNELMDSKILCQKGKKYYNLLIISLFLALLYLTRAEAFIYILSIGLIFLIYEINSEKQNKKTIYLILKILLNTAKKLVITILFFVIFISPYLYHLHNVTGKWGLTNKGSSNLRQAELRGTDRMDDSGFEKAVGELTPDKHNLVSGFVGGLKYSSSKKNSSIKEFLFRNPEETVKRIATNQYKLYTKNLIEIIVGDSVKLFYSKDSSFSNNYIFLLIVLIPIFLIIFGFYKLVKDKKYDFLIISIPFFIIASVFFTIFFVLNRYFIIFLPLFLIVLVYGIEKIQNSKLKVFLIVVIIGINCLSLLTFYNSRKLDDSKYEVKKVAGNRIKNNLLINTGNPNSIKIMERFPITTYYTGTKERWLTPYTEKIDDLIEYAKYNKIDYLVADTLDFKEYRQQLTVILKDNYKNKSLTKIKEFQVNNEKLILYKIIN